MGAEAKHGDMDTEKMRAHLRGMQWKVAELEKICRRKEREGGPREMKRERERENEERKNKEDQVVPVFEGRASI